MIRSSLRFSILALGLALAAPLLGWDVQVLFGQELPWLKGGRVRLDFAPEFWTWDSRYGVNSAGSAEVELLGSDLTADPMGSNVLPDLAELEASLAEALGDPSYRVKLGTSRGYIDQSRMVFPFRLEVGVTDWLTIGAMAPLVRPRTEITFTLNGDSLSATDGFSPFSSDPGSVIAFLDGFRGAVLAAETAHPGDPAVVEAQAYLDALNQAYTHGSFFPVTGSGPGNQLQARLDDLRASLEALGVTGVPNTLPLATDYLTEGDFQEFMGQRFMRAYKLEDYTNLWSLGDVEITANALLVRRGFDPDSMGVLPNLRFQLGGGALVRLGTGEQADPLRFFDQNIGDGQVDFEGNVFGLLEVGNRFGAWGTARFGVQTEGDAFKRITDPAQVLPRYRRAAPLRWTPGDYLELDVNPRFRITSAMSLGARYHLWSKDEDSYALGTVDSELVDPALLPPAELLNLETEQKLQEIGFTASYSTVEAHERGEASMPLFIRVTYFHPVSGSGGQTPKGGRFQVGLTIYKSLWGGDPSPSEELPGMLPGSR